MDQEYNDKTMYSVCLYEWTFGQNAVISSEPVWQSWGFWMCAKLSDDLTIILLSSKLHLKLWPSTSGFITL